MKTLKALAIIAIVGLVLLATQTAFPAINIPNALVAFAEAVWNAFATFFKALGTK